jgi:hypothetical protein
VTEKVAAHPVQRYDSLTVVLSHQQEEGRGPYAPNLPPSILLVVARVWRTLPRTHAANRVMPEKLEWS